MAFWDQLKETFSTDQGRGAQAQRSDSDPLIDRLRADVRQAETTNLSPALDNAWNEISQFRKDHPEKVEAMTAALTRDALLPQIEIVYLSKEGLSKFGMSEQHPINDHINEQQMARASSTDPFERALIDGLKKDFRHYTNTGGDITRLHINNEL